MVSSSLWAQNEDCLPSVFFNISKISEGIKCPTSNSGIVELGNVKTVLVKYQPSIRNGDQIFEKISAVYTAGSGMGSGELTVQSELRIPENDFVNGSLDNFKKIIEEEGRFKPYSSNAVSEKVVRPSIVKSQQYYVDTSDESQKDCVSAYKNECLSATFKEAVEFKVDTVTRAEVATYEQSRYSSPVDLAGGGSQGSEEPIKGSISINVARDRSQNITNWQLEKTVQSYRVYEASKRYANAANEEFKRTRVQQFVNYQNQIKALKRRSERVSQSAQKALESLADNILEANAEDLQTPNSVDWYSNKTSFEYNEFDEQSRAVTEALLDNAREDKNANLYEEQAAKLLNTKGTSQIEGVTNESGILQSRDFDQRLAENYFDKVDLSKIKSDHNKRILRNLGNKFQVRWFETKGLEYAGPESSFLYGVGASMYKEALGRAESESLEFLSYSELSIGFLEASANFSVGLGKGLGNSLYDLAKSIPELYSAVVENYDKIPTTSEEFVRFGQAVVKSLPGVKKALVDVAVKYRDEFRYGDADRKGELVGYALTEAVMAFVPVTKVAKLAKVAKAADVASDLKVVAGITSKLSNATLKAVDGLSGKRREYMTDIISAVNKSEVAKYSNNLEEIVKTLSAEKNEDILYGMKKLISSTRRVNPDNFKRVLANEKIGNFRSVYKTFKKLEPIIGQMEGVSIKGYVARSSLKEHLRGLSPLNRHPGNFFASGRYGVGGFDAVDVMSYGYGEALNRAYITAQKEAGRTISNADKYAQASSFFERANVLDLTKVVNKKKLGVVLDSDSYTDTHIIGVLAEKKGFDGVLAESVKDSGGKVLHLFKED